MRLFIHVAVFTTLAVVLTGCPCPPAPMLTLSGADADLVGVWEGVRIQDGRANTTVRATFTDGAYNFVIGEDTLEGVYAVDMGQSPNAIDFGTTCSSFIDAEELRLGVGRYELVDANTLRFNTVSASSVGAASSERPDAVETPDMGYFSLTRVP